MPLEKSLCDISCLSPTSQVTTSEGAFPWIALLRKWNVRGFRNWFGCDYRPKPSIKKSAFDSARSWAQAGFTPTICLATQSWGDGTLPTSTEARACAKRLVDAAGDIPGLRFEVGNEPNHGNDGSAYWPGKNPQQFVDRVANPMYEVFHAAGIEVVGASVTYSIDYLKRLLKAGLRFDALGFHPYRRVAADHKPMLETVATLAGGKPVDLTEWNIFLGGNYRANFDPKHPKAKTPKRSADFIIDQQRQSWRILQSIPAVRSVAYFISHSAGAAQRQWKHSTGPLCLLEITGTGTTKKARTTPFAERFFATAGGRL